MVNLKENLFFQTPIYDTVLSDIDNRQIERELYSFKEERQEVNFSNRGGWQSESIRARPENCGSLNVVFDKIVTLVNTLPLKNKINHAEIFYWININGYRDYNTLHHHCGKHEDLSGIYYVKIPKDTDSAISFADPRSKVSANPFYTANFLNYEEYVRYEPSEGSLLLFPTFFEHQVEPNNSKEDRISIAFNLSLVCHEET